jgi:peptidoglycan/xylan/chitin deacetylase (PgdA/CDA1 family)
MVLRALQATPAEATGMSASTPRLTILLYHGVTAGVCTGVQNYSGKHIRKDHFESQMSFLRDRNLTVSMDEVVDRYERGGFFDSDRVAVTFDDGFRNNATVAAPIMERYCIPATFYVSTGLMGSSGMFWVDQIEDMINRCAKASIDVALPDAKQCFPLSTDREKVRAIDEIKAFCKRSADATKNQVIASLRQETGVAAMATASPNYETMSWEEIRSLDAHPLFTIGGHSVDHRILSRLPEADMRREIDDSLQTLERHLGHEIVHYAYPEGQSDHYNDAVIAHLRRKGIRCCPSAISGVNGPRESLFHLRRIMVGFNGQAFPFPAWREAG